ncbi:MAG: MBL fold metallo-hydrolase [Lactimicrobium sp.]|jgi:L-ascorbate metabolism protein UlaG (beta-lactamase superfamily)|uniref:MBL fold metallo-hydrolase n=1 Tax=Lactimicrobium sp. TaxID=2563780 RepID=UPI002F359275
MMNITPIAHSSFLIETSERYLLFDWAMGSLPAMGSDKPLYVFVSHSHFDHYDPKIFSLHAEKFILSDEINDSLARRDDVIHLHVHQSISIDGMRIMALASNDLGCAFVIDTKDGSIYHAGDLNNWWWDGDEEDRKLADFYHRELSLIKGKHFACAMIPYDLRIKQPDYGIKDFLQYCTAERIYPMHWNASRQEVMQRIKTDPVMKGIQNVYF